MPVTFKGNTTTIAESPVYSLPFKITFFTIANKNTGSTQLNVSVTKGPQSLSIVPQNLNLDEGDMLEGTSEIIMEAGNFIRITTDNPIDYYFNIENIPSD